MRYIEKDFPIEKLNILAKSEGNDKRWGRPIYQMHKWWARRLGCVFRSIILASFLPDDISEEDFWKYYYNKIEIEKITGKRPVILDPFMGGGTTLVEAIRMGIRAIGIDINPVAWFVTKKELDPFDEKEFDKEFKQLEDTVGEKIKGYYKTKCPKCEKEKAKREEKKYEWDEGNELADVMYVFWVKKVKCLNPTCKKDVKLHHTFKIATFSKKNKKDVLVVFCPECYHVFETERDDTENVCSKCNHKFIPNFGYENGGAYSCPHCGQKYNTLDSVRKIERPLDVEMYGIEYYCEKHGRGYKSVDEYDIELFNKAKVEFEKRKNSLLFPRNEIPDGFNTKQAKNYYYHYFYQMFNERQLLCLGSLLEEILKIKDENTKEFMLLTLSDSINANNMFCIYNCQAQKLEPLFGDHHYAPPCEPVENNIWGTKYGRGTFIKYIEKLKRGTEYKKKPFEKNFEGKDRVVIDERIVGYSPDNVKELASARGDYYIVCGTSEDLSFIPSNVKVDAIITDPPYYDNVMYSEIADFFYSWLRLGLTDKYPWFNSETTINKREIIKNDMRFDNDGKTASEKAEEFYLRGIKRVFKESHSKLAEDGIFVFTFHHQDTKAWASILEPIVEAGFYVEQVYPVQSELRGGLRIVGKKAINYDTIIVCRKRSETPSEISWSSLRPRIYNATKDTISRLLKTRPSLNEGDIFVIALGKGLEIYSKNYPNVLFKEGKLSPRDATLMMGDLVDEIMQEIKESELPSGLDDVSKIYLGYLLTENTIDYNFLNKLVRSKNFDIRKLENESIIEKEKKSEYRVLGPAKRAIIVENKMNLNEDLLYIDKIHYLIHQYRRSKPIALYLSRWKDETLSMALKLYYEKTKDENLKNIIEMLDKTIEIQKAPTLDDF